MKKLFVALFHTILRKTSAQVLIASLQREDHLRELNRNCNCKGTFYPDAQVHNMPGNASLINIGKDSHIRGILVIFKYGGKIEIGENVYLGEGSRIWSGESVKVGNNVLISHHVTIVDTNSHELDYRVRAERSRDLLKNGPWKTKGEILSAPIVIEDDVWISFNVSILKGVTIGRGSIIGAGAVVTKSVPPFSMVKGPAAHAVPLPDQLNRP